MRLNRETFPLVVEGIPFIILAAVITAIGGLWGKIYLFFPFLVVTGFLCSFFRNPRRCIPRGEGLILSPADGRIVVVKKEAEGAKVSIFMSVFNCHVNRAPAAGRITEISYKPGKFLPANKGEASRKNEQNALQLQSGEGLTMRFVQVAGILARRIVCYVRKGDAVRRGEIFGTILFGSRVDLYLPRGVVVRVQVGERVTGGESIVGVIQ